jgi:cold shock protein
MHQTAPSPAPFNPVVPPPRLTGAVRKLKDHYGFIAGDDGVDYFFHWSAMNRQSKNFRDLAVQDRVSFEIVKVDSKARAVNIFVV